MNEKGKTPKEKCHLHEANGLEAWCSRESCIYWRLLEPLDVDADSIGISNDEGCGLQHYRIVENLSPEMAQWLLSMKKRLENTSPELEKARITFRRREQEK